MAKRISKEIKEKIIKLKQEGLSNNKIASKLFISEGSVRNLLKAEKYDGKNCPPGRTKRLSEREEKMLCREYDKGFLENTTHGVAW